MPPGQAAQDSRVEQPMRANNLASPQRTSNRIELTHAWIESDTIKDNASATDKVDRSSQIAAELEQTLNSAASDKVYKGSKVNFEANDADVHDIFRLVAATSGLNILTGTDVVGKVNISLKDVPWDQLLDVILQQAQLKIGVTGNVVRVMSVANYNRELDDKKKSLALTSALEPTIMAILPVSFAKASELKIMIERISI
jgi:type II secretory pathway component HofQ